MDEAERAELVEVFVAEGRERLRHFADLLPALEVDPAADAEVRRELHTLKGAARMMELDGFAELCHGAEGIVALPPARTVPVLAAVHDALAAAIDRCEQGAPETRDDELLATLAELEREAGSAARDDHPPERARASDRGGVEAAGLDPAGLDPAARGGRVPSPDPMDAFAERGVRMRTVGVATGRLAARLDELARRATDALRDPQPGQALALLAAALGAEAAAAAALENRLARAAEEQIEAVLEQRLAPLRALFQGLARHARELARALGRELRVELAGESTRLDRRTARELEGALRHLVTNAVDHALEPPDERLRAGKSAAGLLRIEARAAGRGVEIVVADDGRGMDRDALVRKAVAAGLVPEGAAAALDEAAALRLALLPGLSTRGEATALSGRGVGLDAVAAAVVRLGGGVAIESRPGAGTRFLLDLPTARRGERVLLLRAGGVRFALPAIAVRRVTVPPAEWGVAAGDPRSGGGHSGRELAVVDPPYGGGLSGRELPFVDLAGALGLAAPGVALLVEVEAAGGNFACAVDRVDGEEEVLVRPLPRTLPLSAGVDGAALLASGEPVAVLAPHALLALGDEARPATPQTAGGTAPHPAAGAAPHTAGGTAVRRAGAGRVLLVDDSPVTREIERRLLEQAGFAVAMAGDGEEALRRLEAEPFDAMVTDIEMPLLDGFALTARLRADARFVRFPIVVVSTRGRPEDKLRGLRAGADAYLTKQGLSAADLVDTVRRLTGR